MHERTITTKQPLAMPQNLNGEIQRRLLDERAEVIREIFALALIGNSSKVNLHDNDYAQVSQLRDLEFSRRELLNGRLRQLDDALGRVDSGLFGDCLECGAPIGQTRLEADPAAPLCVSCQSRSEIAVTRHTL